MTTSISYHITFARFKAICEEHGLTSKVYHPSTMRRFYYKQCPVVRYHTRLQCPVTDARSIYHVPRVINSEQEFITYIEQTKNEINKLIETNATMELINQIEQL